MSFQPRCSICFTEIVSPQSIFTSCGHFICPKCANEKMSRNTEICAKCGQSCSILYMDDNMPDEVQQYICMNPGELFLQAVEIYRFQENHTKAYLSFLSEEVVKQKQNYEMQIIALKNEIQQLKARSNYASVASTPSHTYRGVTPFKRPDFLSRFKNTISSTSQNESNLNGSRTLQTLSNQSQPGSTSHLTRLEIPVRPGTPSFIDRSIDKKPINPFSKQNDVRDMNITVATPSHNRRGLDIPGSITRHPQLTKTPIRLSRENTPTPPFQLLRPPKSAPVGRSTST